MNRYHKDGTLPPNHEVFVFGSNLAGIHGAGAAKVAQQQFGAQYGIGKGWQPSYRSYAIPTKDRNIDTISLEEIKIYVDDFLRLTVNPFVVNNGYFVSRIGCGLAGYKDEQIAPMFKGAENCSFAENWRQYL